MGKVGGLMRRASWVVTLLLLVGLCSFGCEERENSSDTTSSDATASTQPTTRRTRLSPTSNLLAAVTRPAQPTTATSAPADHPLATPSGAAAHLLALMSREDVEGVRTMMTDPLPANVIRGEVRGVADRLAGGAKWTIADAKESGVAAVVIVETKFPDGKLDHTPMIFVQRYDRWKVLLGPVNPKKYTEGEVISMNKLSDWLGTRLSELRRASVATTTMPATTRTSPAPPG
jgi:hypothetical protein